MEDYPIYYRIFKSYNYKNKLTIVCMQDFDEIDYDQKRFLKDKEGYVLKFDDKEKAIEWLLKNIKEEFIDPEYLIMKIIINKEDVVVMDNITIKINNITLNISQVENRIIIKPITEIPQLKEYSFNISKNSSIEYFVGKLNMISMNIAKYYNI